MSKKELKTIDLKGKKYVQVDTRVTFFNEEYPNGKIETKPHFVEKAVYFKAVITPDIEKPERIFTGHSFGNIQKEKALEKLETVAVGRALAFMGIGIVEGIASADEIQNFQNKQQQPVNQSISFEQGCELAKKGELMCSECASTIEYSELKNGEARLKCPKDWKHKTFKPKAEHKAEVKKILEDRPF